MASIFGKRFAESCGIFKEIALKINSMERLSEVDQKAINQLQLVFKRFSADVEDPFIEEMSTVNRQIKNKMSRVVKTQTMSSDQVDYDAWHKELGLSNEMFSEMLKTVVLFQLTEGCSNFCRRCNEWALPGVRKHFTFEAVQRLITQLFESGNREFVLYSASDPLDWRSREKTIEDIVAFMSCRGYESRYGLLTKIPRGSEKIAENLLLSEVNLAVSLTRKNNARVKRIEDRIGKRFEIQHDTDQLEIQAGLDEDFSSIKPSVTDNYGTEVTPEGAFAIIPTFTSALNPTGQCRMQVTSHTEFFLKRRVGREALSVAYFKPLKAVKPQAGEFTLNGLLNAQVENILLDNGRPELYPPGMMSLKEHFKIYEPEATASRKKLLGTVVKDLRNKLLSRGAGIDDRGERRQAEFNRRVHDYSEFCEMSRVTEFKKNAFSFFLKAVAEYAKSHPTEKEIVLHLRNQDKLACENRLKNIIGSQRSVLESIIEKSETGLFDLFETLMFTLLDNPDHQNIQEFIHRNPASYDANADRFVRSH